MRQSRNLPINGPAVFLPLDGSDSALETKAFRDFPAWVKKEAAFRTANADYVRGLPLDQKAFVGKDGWLFFRNEIDYLNARGPQRPAARMTIRFPGSGNSSEFLDKQGYSPPVLSGTEQVRCLL